MKAVIAVPPIQDFYFTRHRFSCLGARILLQELQQCGLEPVYFNFPLLRSKGISLQLPGEFNYLIPFMIPGEAGKLSFFTRFQHFGPVFRDCARMIEKETPDLIFLSTFAFCYAPSTLQLAAEIRQVLPAATIVAGGAGVTVHPRYFTRDKNINYVLTGEAEVCAAAFVRALQNNGRGLEHVPQLWKDSTGPVDRLLTPPGRLPFTWNRTLETRDTVFISTSLSRGCPGKCRFCVNYNNNDFRVLPYAGFERGLPALLDSLAGSRKTVHFNFEDDNLLSCADNFLQVLTKLHLTVPGIRFYTENGIDYTQLTSRLTDKLIDLGMQQFNISLGSLEPRLLEQETRRGALEHYLAVLAAAARRHVPCITYFICGFRNETREHVAAVLVFLARLPTRLGISMFYAVPGLPDFPDPGLFDGLSPRLCLGACAYPWNNSLTTAELVTAFRLSRLINLLKSDRKSEEENRLIQWIFREKKLYTIVRNRKKRSMTGVPGMDTGLVETVLEQIKKNFSLA